MSQNFKNLTKSNFKFYLSFYIFMQFNKSNIQICTGITLYL